ncbi:YD repeat-containing protein [Desulfatibacillum alkenivorans DSM 16219]|jgi:YD repeat-containing protein|uniref:YD repeat-containing protein n=1 Tax=Desulfatibacillum alkenivorans DSM 16219 TaxID=1121393 RepID=A0A1M6XE96_9BACT|nr:RHS repeat protein [Desulfatibacillum alkenivorans]SHL04179.1 YD repeat-containing protein [Desulfatibacillum alkenivorans DSM 16219]
MEALIYQIRTLTETQYTRLLQTSATLSKDPAGNVVASNEYTLDKSGNVTNRISHNDSIGYAYDDLGMLISHVSQSSGTETFTYDEVANIATALENGQPITFTRNANNELLSYGDATFQYDENGAVISRTENNETVNYFYDVDGRMIRVENGSGGVIAQYYYDPFGRRLWKDVSGTRTCYFYSDEGLIGEFTSTGTLIKSYGYKPDSMWSSNPLFMVQDGVYYYYHNDRSSWGRLGVLGDVFDWSSWGHPIMSPVKGDFDFL